MTTIASLRLALVSMPWAAYDRPSAAVAALAAYVRRERPAIEVTTVSEHVRVADAMGLAVYGPISERSHQLGELLSLAVFHPEREARIREDFVSQAPGSLGEEALALTGVGSWEEIFDHAVAVQRALLDRTVERLAGRFDVVGLTTSFGQLFANLALARRLREASPATRIVLGGATVSDRVGPSLLAEYPFVDAIVQGEGERPLVALLDAIGRGGPWRHVPAVLHRETSLLPVASTPVWEVDSMDDLPYPDYDEYAALAAECGIVWPLPIEGSRGCWWDRTKRTGDSRKTCQFCNLNIQWNGYREKSVARVLAELQALSERYSNTQIYFLDSILRHQGIGGLMGGIAALGRHFEMFYEIRAHLRAADFLALWEAGVTEVQIGIEGLSSSYLARIGKGTTAIQNLQAMKLCAELGIKNNANLIIRFPGSTAAEVEETRRNALRHAIAYEPCSALPFRLGVGSGVEVRAAEFGLGNVRNRALYQAGLPEDVQQRLALFDLDYDDASGTADWSPVYDAVVRWRARQREVSAPLLVYFDGGRFLTIVDRRESHEVVQLREPLRSLYLFASEIRTRRELVDRFAAVASEAEVVGWLDGLVEDALVFQEDGRYLALAMASRPHLAAARLRASAGAPENGVSTARQSTAATASL